MGSNILNFAAKGLKNLLNFAAKGLKYLNFAAKGLKWGEGKGLTLTSNSLGWKAWETMTILSYFVFCSVGPVLLSLQSSNLQYNKIQKINQREKITLAAFLCHSLSDERCGYAKFYSVVL